MKSTLFAVILFSTFKVQAQISPLSNHQSTIISDREAELVWSEMRSDFLPGSECFNRALSWMYDINKEYGHEAKKILIHYSYKYNKELSSKWGFHIAPMYNVEGQDTVFDKGFVPWIHAPLTPKMWEEKFLAVGTQKLVEKRIKLKEQITKLEQSIAELEKSADYDFDLFKTKKEKLIELNKELKDFKLTDEDLIEQRPKKIASLERWIEYLRREMQRYSKHSHVHKTLQNDLKLKMILLTAVKFDLNYAAHIECEKIDSIEELDYNKKKAWCYIQEISQYYWGVPQLRLLNYGPGYGMNSLPSVGDLPSARQEGAKYVHNNDFNMNQVWIARKQAFGRAYKEIWSEEYNLKKDAKIAVRNLYKINRKLSAKVIDSIELIRNIKELGHSNESDGRVAALVNKANRLHNQIVQNKIEVNRYEDQMKSIINESSVKTDKKKVYMYEKSQNYLIQTQNNIEELKHILKVLKE